MHMSAFVALVAAPLMIPVSDQVPTFNVEPSCKGAAAASTQMVDAQSYPACMDEENAARRELVSIWQTFRVADRMSCTAESSSLGIASYVELLVCLQIAQNPGGLKTNLKCASRKK